MSAQNPIRTQNRKFPVQFAASTIVLLVTLFSCEAQAFDFANPPSHSSPDKQFEVVVIPDTTDSLFQYLTIHNSSGDTVFSEKYEAPQWSLWGTFWRSDSNYVAITANFYRTQVDTVVLHRVGKKFVLTKLPGIPSAEGCHVAVDHWRHNGDLALDISFGNNRRAFPGDVISSYRATVRFRGHPLKGEIYSRTKMERETVPHEPECRL
jgi:hypothetical protein